RWLRGLVVTRDKGRRECPRREIQMLKRVLLATTFIAALGGASLGMSNKASAWHDCDDDYRYTYAYPAYASYGPRVVYYPELPVRTYPVYYSGFGDDYRYSHHHDHH